MFNASAETIFTELLQNARRSGATCVDITLRKLESDQTAVTLCDNGTGIDDPQNLLAYGENGWSAETVKNEDAAGMGFACLARAGCTMSSRTSKHPGWITTLTPDVFAGETPAIVTTIPENMATGTTVRFTLKTGGGTLFRAIEKTALYYPVTVRVKREWKENEKHTALQQENFLKDCTTIKEWRGLKLGITVNKGDYRAKNLNFYGHTIAVSLPRINSLNDTRWNVKIDVDHCTDLELVLPARQEIIQGIFLEEIKLKAKETLYQTMLAHINTGNAYLCYKDYQNAKSMKIDFPEPPQRLNEWLPDDYNGEQPTSIQTLPDNAFLINPNAERPDQHTLYQSLQKVAMESKAFTCDNRYTGYKWYDNLDKITEWKNAININDQITDIGTLKYEKVTTLSRQKELPLSLKVTFKKGESNPFYKVLPAPIILFFHDYDIPYSEGAILLGNKDDWTTDKLTNILTDAYFTFNEDWDANSWEEQQKEFETNMFFFIYTLLDQGPEDAAITIENTLNDELWPLIKKQPEMEFNIQIVENRFKVKATPVPNRQQS